MSTNVRQLFDLEERPRLVTGGSRGLGLQIAAGARRGRRHGAAHLAQGRLTSRVGGAPAGAAASTATGSRPMPASRATSIRVVDEDAMRAPRQGRHPDQQRRREPGARRPRTIRSRPGTR